MNWRAKNAWLFVLFVFYLPVTGAAELYFVDAHSQFDTDADGELIIKRMDEGGVYKTILASRSGRKAREAVELADEYPDRIVASVRTKSRHYMQGSKQYFKKLDKRVNSGRFFAMAELLVFHAQKGNKAPEVRIDVDDGRVLAALDHAKEQGWPFVIHIEFASLSSSERDDYMKGLKKLLNQHSDHPFALIHMGQLPHDAVGALIKAHNNLYFLTAHSDPVTTGYSKQPWVNMMDKDKFKPEWKELITQHPDRFVFALDNVWGWQWKDTYMKHITVWRSALSELPEDIAHAVAHGNAERLWKLEPKP